MKLTLTKRDFVKGAAATVAVAATAQVTARAEPFDVVVYNEWFPQACTYADRLSRAQGARALPIEGDAGRLWYGTLRELIVSGRRRIAGMTTHTDLLILETLARAHGLRVQQRDNLGRLVSWVLI